MIEEEGLHYHNGYKYTGNYKDGLEEMIRMTLNVLIAIL